MDVARPSANSSLSIAGKRECGSGDTKIGGNLLSFGHWQDAVWVCKGHRTCQGKGSELDG
jgi:hypothetical protein